MFTEDDDSKKTKAATTKFGVSADILAQFKKAKQQRQQASQKATPFDADGDDDDDDGKGKRSNDQNDDNDNEDDPLDAFMESVDSEVTKIRQQDAVRMRQHKMLGIIGKSKRGEKLSDANGTCATKPTITPLMILVLGTNEHKNVFGRRAVSERLFSLRVQSSSQVFLTSFSCMCLVRLCRCRLNRGL